MPTAPCLMMLKEHWRRASCFISRHCRDSTNILFSPVFEGRGQTIKRKSGLVVSNSRLTTNDGKNTGTRKLGKINGPCLKPPPRVRRHIDESTWAEIRTAYASGIGLREIARNMGIPEGTVLARAKREGWTQQIQNAKALTKREDAPLTVTPVQAVAMSIRQRGERHVERMAGVSERGVDHVETLNGPEILDAVDQIDKLDKVARRSFGLEDKPYGEHFTLNVLNLDMLVEDQGDNPEPIDQR